MPLRIKKSGFPVILVKWLATIAKRRAILQINTPSQKTSISLGNFCAGNWWWWKGCAQKGTLYPLPGSIPRKPRIGKPGINKGLAW